MENSSGSEIFMVIIRIMMDSEILRISNTSSTLGCSGITRNRTMTTTIRDIALLSIRLISLPGAYFLMESSDPSDTDKPIPPPLRYTAQAGSLG